MFFYSFFSGRKHERKKRFLMLLCPFRIWIAYIFECVIWCVVCTTHESLWNDEKHRSRALYGKFVFLVCIWCLFFIFIVSFFDVRAARYFHEYRWVRQNNNGSKMHVFVTYWTNLRLVHTVFPKFISMLLKKAPVFPLNDWCGGNCCEVQNSYVYFWIQFFSFEMFESFLFSSTHTWMRMRAKVYCTQIQ